MFLFLAFFLVVVVFPITEQIEEKQHKGRYTREIRDYNVVIPKKVSHNGDFLTHLIPHEYKRSYNVDKHSAEIEPEEKIHYHIPIEGEPHHVELWPNYDFISPGMVIETRQGDDKGDIRRAGDVQCHYHGHIRGHGAARSALSTCYGLAGVLRTNRGSYIIEPVKDHDHNSGEEHPHIIYKQDAPDNSDTNCATRGNLVHSLASRVVREEPSVVVNATDKASRKSLANDVMYVETMVVLDKSLIAYHQETNVENYVFTVMNMASSLFHDVGLKRQVNVVIVRIVRLDDEEREMSLTEGTDAEKVLDFFCSWQMKMNPGGDTHPNHHDVAVLITRANICKDDNACGVLGASKLGGACATEMSCALAVDTGLMLGYVIAHEIGHMLGMEHDEKAEGGCDSKLLDGGRTLMGPSVTMRVSEWSTCSQEALRSFMQLGYGSCLLDEPADHYFPVQDLLPGAMYDADYKALMVPDRSCENLSCEVAGYGCVQTHLPPAPGTQCGEKKWCFQRRCVEVGERPGAVHGGWSAWSGWSACSRTCGSGVASSRRQCNTPYPEHGGEYCRGDAKRHQICSTEVCPIGQPSFRDVQCAEFNNWSGAEDEKTHVWKGFYNHDDNPCILYCKSDANVVATLRPQVVDGTTCRRGIRDICIGGVCREVPCDLNLESKAVEDVCGVCHGDGTGCVVRDGVETFAESKRDLMKLVEVPVGTRNIRVEEMEPTMALIVVMDAGNSSALIRGDVLGMFEVPGSKAWLGMIRKGQEALNIPGPVTKPLTVFVRPIEKVTFQYSMALKRDEGKRSAKGCYSWDFIDWTKCSAQCGPGVEMATAKCVEHDGGLVEDGYCSDFVKPDSKIRPCFLRTCKARWVVGEWQGECKSINDKRTRMVKCVKPTGDGEGESDIIANIECTGAPKPKVVEPCASVKKLNTSCSYVNEPFRFHDEPVRKRRSNSDFSDDIWDPNYPLPPEVENSDSIQNNSNSDVLKNTGSIKSKSNSGYLNNDELYEKNVMAMVKALQTLNVEENASEKSADVQSARPEKQKLKPMTKPASKETSLLVKIDHVQRLLNAVEILNQLNNTLESTEKTVFPAKKVGHVDDQISGVLTQIINTLDIDEAGKKKTEKGSFIRKDTRIPRMASYDNADNPNIGIRKSRPKREHQVDLMDLELETEMDNFDKHADELDKDYSPDVGKTSSNTEEEVTGDQPALHFGEQPSSFAENEHLIERDRLYTSVIKTPQKDTEDEEIYPNLNPSMLSKRNGPVAVYENIPVLTTVNRAKLPEEKSVGARFHAKYDQYMSQNQLDRAQLKVQCDALHDTRLSSILLNKLEFHSIVDPRSSGDEQSVYEDMSFLDPVDAKANSFGLSSSITDSPLCGEIMEQSRLLEEKNEVPQISDVLLGEAGPQVMSSSDMKYENTRAAGREGIHRFVNSGFNPTVSNLGKITESKERSALGSVAQLAELEIEDVNSRQLDIDQYWRHKDVTRGSQVEKNPDGESDSIPPPEIRPSLYDFTRMKKTRSCDDEEDVDADQMIREEPDNCNVLPAHDKIQSSSFLGDPTDSDYGDFLLSMQHDLRNSFQEVETPMYSAEEPIDGDSSLTWEENRRWKRSNRKKGHRKSAKNTSSEEECDDEAGTPDKVAKKIQRGKPMVDKLEEEDVNLTFVVDKDDTANSTSEMPKSRKASGKEGLALLGTMQSKKSDSVGKVKLTEVKKVKQKRTEQNGDG